MSDSKHEHSRREDWGRLLFQPETDRYGYEPDLVPWDKAFKLAWASSIALIAVAAVLLFPSGFWLILLIPGIVLFALLYEQIAEMPFRIYEKGVTRTTVPFMTGLLRREVLIPFERVTHIGTVSRDITRIEDLAITYLDGDAKEAEYFPFRGTENHAYTDNLLDIHHVLARTVPARFDDDVLTDSASFDAMVATIEDGTTLEHGHRISKDPMGLIYLMFSHSLIIVTFAMTGLCLFLGSWVPAPFFYLVAVLTFSLGWYLVVDLVQDTRQSILGRMAFHGRVENDIIKFQVGRWERFLYDVGEGVRLSAISRAKILLKAWYHEPYLKCYLSSGEGFILPQGMSSRIVGSLRGDTKGFEKVNREASECPRIIGLRRRNVAVYFLPLCLSLVALTFGVLAYLFS